jgi:murein DD-endopeptidase MepM/ murein hydrolase activator NlpD
MGILQGKGIWTLYDDIDVAVANAPKIGAKYILCKVSKHGGYEPTVAEAALAMVKKDPQLTPIAWNHSRMIDPEEEADCIQKALAAGYAAFVVEATSEIMGKSSQAQKFLERVRQLSLDTSKIYLCGDSRLDSMLTKIPYEILSRACRGGFLTMTYTDIMPTERKNAAENYTNQTYDEYKRNRLKMLYTGSLMPVLNTTWDQAGKVRMTKAEFNKWRQAVSSRTPTFISLNRAGLAPAELMNEFRDFDVAQSETVTLPDQVEDAILVIPNGPGFAVEPIPPNIITEGWTTEFVDMLGQLVRCRLTNQAGSVIATYTPGLPKESRYTAEVFIPSTHATTKGAAYQIVHHKDGQRQEAVVVINQLSFSNNWVRLGTFRFDPQQPQSGQTTLTDKSSADITAKEIAFSTIRWREVPAGGPGFDAPIGTEEERAGPQVWPGRWQDANPYLTKYDLGYHTGSDLNLNFPSHNLDKGKPVFAAADGEVIFAKITTGTWRGLIVIRHAPLPNGTPVYSRYGHVENIQVSIGDAVTRGQQISTVGLFGDAAKQNYHLHFDISTTDILETHPTNWPGEAINAVRTHYVDPRKFIEDHRP